MGAPRRSSPAGALCLALAAGILVAFGAFAGMRDVPLVVPAVVLGVYVVMSGVTFAVYAHDKSVAGTARRRVPERTLLVLGFLGGWPGAGVAQQALRHKTRKTSFQLRFWATVLANLAVLGGLLVALTSRG
jgi:uncharacterized membrane protein YsdA (DUF1294 family)